MKDGLVVQLSTNDDQYSGRKNSVYLWTPGQELSKPIWESERIRFSKGNSVILDETITKAIKQWSIVYLGLNTGSVHRILTIGDEPRVETYPSRFFDYSGIRGDARGRVEHDVITGRRDITGLVEFEGHIYDGSNSGLFKTEENKQVDTRRVSSVVVYKNRLCIVPWPHEMTRESFENDKAGCLVDAITKDVIADKFTPFDGSGMKQADYFIHGENVFLSHGNHPCQKVSVKRISTGETISSISVLDSSHFVEYQGEVYDMRSGFTQGSNLRLVNSMNGYDGKGVIFSVPEGYQYASVLSTRDQGILVSLFDPKKKISRVVSHLAPDKPLIEVEGVLKIF